MFGLISKIVDMFPVCRYVPVVVLLPVDQKEWQDWKLENGNGISVKNANVQVPERVTRVRP